MNAIQDTSMTHTLQASLTGTVFITVLITVLDMNTRTHARTHTHTHPVRVCSAAPMVERRAPMRMIHLSVNASTALQSLLKAPNWRPRFKFYHW